MKKLPGFFLLLAASVGYGQQRLSLSDAINTALKNSLGIQLGKNNVSIATINNSYGVAGGLPMVSATATDVEQSTSIDQRYADPANNKSSANVSSNSLNAGVTGSVLVYNGERVVTAKKRLGTVADQSEQQLISRTQIIVANVMLKYYDIVRQQGYAVTLQKAIDVAKKKLQIVQAQVSVGVANNADLFQSQVDLNTQIQTLQSQQLVIDQDKTDLLTLLTLKADSSVTIVDSIVIDKGVQLDSILSGLSQNPDVVTAEQQVQIYQYIEKETGALRYPSLGVNGGYNLSRSQSAAGFSLLNQNYGPFVGVSLSVPIFNGNIYKKQQQVAGINIKTAQLQKDTLMIGYKANIIKNWQGYTSNLQQLETARQNYELSQKLVDLVLQRFQLKQATILDVNQAQQSFENAAYLLINLSYAAKAAEIQLKRYGNKL